METEQSDNKTEAEAPESVKPKIKLRKAISVAVAFEDIQKAKLANSRRCMMHRAVTRDYPEFKMIAVDKHYIRFTEGDYIYTFEQTPLAQSMILKWDAGENIAPFTVQLRNPIIRERVPRKRKDGSIVKTAAPGDDSSIKTKGAMMRPKTEEGKAKLGRDRVFGQKLWPYELKKLRDALQIETPENATP